jgi:uncharacterized protein (DUF983 family)
VKLYINAAAALAANKPRCNFDQRACGQAHMFYTFALETQCELCGEQYFFFMESADTLRVVSSVSKLQLGVSKKIAVELELKNLISHCIP